MGPEFVKKIRPLGCAIFLLIAVLTTVLCFTAGRDPIRGYAPAQTTEYYAAHPQELLAELEAQVFPALEGVVSAEAAEDHVTVRLQSDRYAVTRSALLRYFDESLLRLERVE